jgi:hypothetical protein
VWEYPPPCPPLEGEDERTSIKSSYKLKFVSGFNLPPQEGDTGGGCFEKLLKNYL